MEQYDVLIVGARVAGSSAAILLAEQGKKVLLADKASFPSDTLSTHHMSHVDYLERLGILEKVEATGLRKIERMRTYIGGSFVEGPRSSYTIIPKREHLDSVLLNRAKEIPGITVREQCTILELVREEDRVNGAITENAAGEKETIYCDWVIGADGRHSRVAKWTGADEYQATPPVRPVFYGYYEGIAPLEEPATEIFLNEGRVGFLFPMEEGRDCLGLEVHPEEFTEMMKDPRGEFEAMYKKLYGMEKRMEGAVLQGKVTGTKGVPNHFRQASGPGWILIGDAAHSKDPSTGLGINDAFMQSFLLAEAFKEITAGGQAADVLDQFQKQRDEQLGPGFQLTLDYVHSLRKWTDNEHAVFQAMAANPMVWNVLVPGLDEGLKEKNPLLHRSVLWEAEAFGYKQTKGDA